MRCTAGGKAWMTARDEVMARLEWQASPTRILAILKLEARWWLAEVLAQISSRHLERCMISAEHDARGVLDDSTRSVWLLLAEC